MSNSNSQHENSGEFFSDNKPLDKFIEELQGEKINVIKDEKINDITFILYNNNNDDDDEIGQINFIDLETPKDSQGSLQNSQYSVNSNVSFKDNKNLFNQKTGQGIFIKWIKIEDLYQRKGYHNILLYLMLLYISQELYINDISKLKITLDDYSNVKVDDKTFWEIFGFQHVTGDGEAFLSDSEKFNMEYFKKKINKYFPNLLKKSNLGKRSTPNSGGGSQYIMTKKGKRKIHVGKRGGKYYIMNKKKIYIK